MHTNWQKKVTNSSEAILRARIREKLFGYHAAWFDGLDERMREGDYDRDRAKFVQHEEWNGYRYLKCATYVRSSVVRDDDIWYANLCKSELNIPGQSFQIGETKRLIKDVLYEALGDAVDFKVKWVRGDKFKVTIPEKDFEQFWSRLDKHAPDSLTPEVTYLDRYRYEKRSREATGRV